MAGNPREGIIALEEAVHKVNRATSIPCLLSCLETVLGRLPKQKRTTFIQSTVDVGRGVLARHATASAPDRQDESEEEEEEGEETEEQDQEQEKDSDEIENDKMKKSIKITNAFGDTDGEDADKYKLSTDAACIIPSVLSLLSTLLVDDDKRIHEFSGKQLKQRLNAMVLTLENLALLARTNLNHSNNVSSTAQMAMCILSRLGVEPIFLLRSIPSLEVNADEEHEDAQRLLVGIACYFYINLEQQRWAEDSPFWNVLSPLYRYCLLVPSISLMLKDPAPLIAEKGLIMMRHMLNALTEEKREARKTGHLAPNGREGVASQPIVSVDPSQEANIMTFGVSMKTFVLFAQNLIMFMTNCGKLERRQEAFLHLNTFLSLFEEEERYRLLGDLLRTCPYPSIKGLLIHRLKQETIRAWPKDEEHQQQRKKVSPFSSPKLLDLFPFFMHFSGESNLLQDFDVWMNALNYYRFLLLRDRPKQKEEDSPQQQNVGVWEPQFRQAVEADLLEPLSLAIQRQIKEHTGALTPEEQRKRVALMTKHGFPALRPSDVHSASVASLGNLHVLQQVLDCVFELLRPVASTSSSSSSDATTTNST
ncbi:VWFA domain-containing protein, variant 2 [Balamuthia mandrillaris]